MANCRWKFKLAIHVELKPKRIILLLFLFFKFHNSALYSTNGPLTSIAGQKRVISGTFSTTNVQKRDFVQCYDIYNETTLNDDTILLDIQFLEQQMHTVNVSMIVFLFFPPYNKDQKRSNYISQYLHSTDLKMSQEDISLTIPLKILIFSSSSIKMLTSNVEVWFYNLVCALQNRCRFGRAKPIDNTQPFSFAF